MPTSRLKHIAWGIVLTVLIAVAGITLRRWLRASDDAQRAADVAVARYLDNPDDAEDATRAQFPSAPLELAWTIDDAVRVRVTTWFELPLALLHGIEFSITAEASAPLPPRAPPVIVSQAPAEPPPEDESAITRVLVKSPMIVLVLDLSGSMCRQLGGDGSHLVGCDDPSSSFSALQRAVDQLLARAPEAKLGLVTFASDVIDEVPIARGNAAEIRALLASPSRPCPSATGACETSSWTALDRAADLLDCAGGDEKRYVFFISDGLPAGAGVSSVAEGIARTRVAAERLRGMGATTFTFHLVNTSRQVAELRDFMIGISGATRDVGNPAYYAQASSQAALEQQLGRIAITTAYQVGPITPPAPGRSLEVVLRARDGKETPVVAAPTSISDLGDETNRFAGGSFYVASAGKRLLYVTPHVYQRVTQQHDVLVVRR